MEIQIHDSGLCPVELPIDRYALMVDELGLAEQMALHVAVDLAASVREATGRSVMVRAESGRVGYLVVSERGAVYYSIRAVL